MNKEEMTQKIVPTQGNVLQEVTLRAKLFLHLMADERVSFFAKLIPVATVAYILSPVDLIMGIPGLSALDDLAIFWLGYYAFIELCPPEIVRELAKRMISNNAVVEDLKQPGQDEIVDGEATDVSDENSTP